MIMKAKALVLKAPKELVLEEFDLPTIGDDDALIEVEACGLCGTDHEQYSGILPTGGPTIPGHETVGRVTEIGETASKRFNVKCGDLVAVEVFQSCRKCDNCTNNDYRHCKEHGIFDMYGFIPVSKAPGLWGGYATHLYASKDAMLIKIPESLDPQLATLFNPLGAGIRWAVEVPETKKGDIVAILGPGIRGIAGLVATKQAGAKFVMVTGYGERDRKRLEYAKLFGADLVVDTQTQDPVKELRSATGQLADVVIDVTAKSTAAFGQSVNLCKDGGKIVIAGTKGTTGAENLSIDSIIYKELTILGALGVDYNSYSKAVEILDSNEFPFDQLSRLSIGLNDANNLLSELSEGKQDALHCLINPKI